MTESDKPPGCSTCDAAGAFHCIPCATRAECPREVYFCSVCVSSHFKVEHEWMVRMDDERRVKQAYELLGKISLLWCCLGKEDHLPECRVREARKLLQEASSFPAGRVAR